MQERKKEKEEEKLIELTETQKAVPDEEATGVKVK